MKAVVVGSGAWGTALAVRLCQNGHDVTMWTFENQWGLRLHPWLQTGGHGLPLLPPAKCLSCCSPLY